MMDEEFGGLGDEISRMLHARALRHPDHTDPVGITREDVRVFRGRRRKMVGTTALLTVAVAGVAVFGVHAGHPVDKGEPSSPAPDYVAAATCPQTAKVPVDIPHGATSTQIANALFTAGVVKSTQAYIDAANQNQSSPGIAAGTYSICPRISGTNAVLELLKKSNLSQASQIIVTPHEWAKDVVASLITKRKWKQEDFDAAISGNTIGLPPWSVNSLDHKFTVEGMLAPGTYSLTATDTPQSVLKEMVAMRLTDLTAMGFEAKAKAQTCGTVKCTPEQVLIVASLAEGEVTDPTDGSKVAEGVYRRLQAGDFLGIDSTALYTLPHLPPGQLPTAAQVNDPNNPYSSYTHHGLPPTPVDIPSDDMIKAAFTPTSEGDYYWCVTATGTNFYTQHQKKARDWACSTSQ